MEQDIKSEEPGGERLDLAALTPRQIVAELDRYIVGQERAKRALAVALRDRNRRKKLPPEIVGEVTPRNVILIGPTGVGKTELARRLARLSGSPFIKVEASKFTEVGYVGRDVDSIIRDLADISVDMVRQEKAVQVEKVAEKNAEDRLLEILCRPARNRKRKAAAKSGVGKRLPVKKRRDQLRRELREGKLDGQIVELEVQERFLSSPEWAPSFSEEEADLPFRDFIAGISGSRTVKKSMRVDEAIEYLISEEESRLVDMEGVAKEAIQRLESSGIVFLDELDKIAGRESRFGPEVSREGVQRDILPVVEGTSVSTRYGVVDTEQILFIAAGAFHVAKPSDLIPELQGRFPVRVEMDLLTEQDFCAILSKPENALIKQYKALMATEGVELVFTEEAIREIARLAWLVNETTENIGARRLHTIMEALLEEISFQAPELAEKEIMIDAPYVRGRLSGKVQDSDLSRYIL